MKRLNLSDVTDATQLRLKADTIGFLQDANLEAFASILKALIGTTYSTTTVYILYGCIITGTTITSGAVFYNGEIYNVTGNTLTGTLQFKLNVDNDTTNGVLSGVPLDPVTLVGGGMAYVHNVRDIIIVNDASGFANCTTAIAFATDSLHNPNQLFTKVIPIGAWNMLANEAPVGTLGSNYIATGIDISKVINVNVVIFDDLGNIYPLNMIGNSTFGGTWVYGVFDVLYNLSLTRNDPGIFKDSSFSNATMNRGYITIQYTA